MKVLLLTPSPSHLHLGGMATVGRYREGLPGRGHLCELIGGTCEGGLKQSLEGTIGRFRPDIVHAHDAARTGVALLGLRSPWVVSLSGEDLHQDLLDSDRGPLVGEVLRRAHRVLAPTPEAAALVEQRAPDAVGKIDVVPRSAARLPTTGTDLRRSLGIPHQRFIVFLPGGIRPIKFDRSQYTHQARRRAMKASMRCAQSRRRRRLAVADDDVAGPLARGVPQRVQARSCAASRATGRVQ